MHARFDLRLSDSPQVSLYWHGGFHGQFQLFRAFSHGSLNSIIRIDNIDASSTFAHCRNFGFSKAHLLLFLTSR